MSYLKHSIAIIILGAALGLAFNQFRQAGISLAGFNPFPDVKTVALQVNLPTIDLPGAKIAFDQGTGIFVDARPPELFKAGRIPGAFNIPEKDFAGYFPDFKSNIPADETVVVYCDGQECLASVKIAEELKKNGYSHVQVFFGGWQHWVDAAYPVEW